MSSGVTDKNFDSFFGKLCWTADRADFLNKQFMVEAWITQCQCLERIQLLR